MAPENPAQDAPSPGEDRPSALAEEVRDLRRLLVALQSELKPALQSSLRERSTELQRLGGELSEKDEAVRALRLELDQALRRSAELELDVERWRDAARRGVDEIALKARETAERFERQAAELTEALAQARAQLDSSRAQTRAMTQARDSALRDVERRRRLLGR